jgi:putative membrane protein
MRKTLLHTLILAGTAFCLQFTAPAFAQNPGGAGGQQPGGPTTTQPTQPGGPAAGPGVGPGATSPMDQAGMQPSKWDDKKFVKEAAIGGMAEVELGKLAQQKASSDAVKQFGQKMVNDHSKANEELKAAATKDGLELPTELDKKHQKLMDKLSKLSGPEFDKAYIKNMVKDHKKDVSEFQDEASKGTMPGIKEFAQKTLPTLEQHLQMVKDLNKSGGTTTVSEAKQ